MAESQGLKIHPEREFKFNGPFEKGTMATLKLLNPTGGRICFKIRTTAPWSYVVKPSDGILDPGASIIVPVVCHPRGLEPSPSSKAHKFVVQALHIPDGEVDLEDIWKNVEASEITNTKLRCSFEMPSDEESVKDLYAVQEAHALTGSSTDEDMDMDLNMTMKSMLAEDKYGGASGISLESPESVQLKAENVCLKEEVDRLERQIKASEANEHNKLDQAVADKPTPYALYIAGAIFIALAGVVGLMLSKYV